MQRRLLLFDIDGTLIHSGGAGVSALKLALTERFGIKDDLHDIEIAGMTDSGIVISILKKHKIPTTAENVAAFLQIDVIGDTPRDIACGKALGARTIAVATGSWSRQKLAEHDPDYLIDDLSDVDRLINTLGW